MNIAFEVAPEGVDSDKNAWDYCLFVSDVFDAAGSNFPDFIEQRTIEPEEIPQFTRHGESDVLPRGSG